MFLVEWQLNLLWDKIFMLKGVTYMDIKMKQYSKLNLFEKIYIQFQKKYIRMGLIFILGYFIIDKITLTFLYNLLVFRKYLLDLIVIVYPLVVYIHIRITRNFEKNINSSFINSNVDEYLFYYKKNYRYLEFKIILLNYELQKANIELTPTKFIKFYEEKLENNELFVINNKSKINCFIMNYKNYMLLYYINNIILGNKISEPAYFNDIYNNVVNIFGLIERNKETNNLKKKIFLNLVNKVKFGYFVMIIKYYNDKDYNNLYNILRKYYSVYEYDLSKSILVFLYVSAEKIGKDINFLPEITKQKMYNTLKEEEFIQFIEKELN